MRYITAEEFDLMTEAQIDAWEEEKLMYELDEKAKRLREQYSIKPLSPYHQRLGAMVSNLASGNTQATEINQPKRKSYGRRKRSKW